MFERLLVGYDDSPGARRALQLAVEMARDLEHRELTVIAVAERLPHSATTVGEIDEERAFEERQCRHWLMVAEGYAAQHGIEVQPQIRKGHAAQELLKAADDCGTDLMILGHSGHSAVWGRFLGATVEKVSRHARCSVLIAAPSHGRL